METVEEKIQKILQEIYSKYENSIIYIEFNMINHMIKIFTSCDKNDEILTTFKKMTKDIEHDYSVSCL